MNEIQTLINNFVIHYEKLYGMEKLAEIDVLLLNYKRSNAIKFIRYKMLVNKYYLLIDEFNAFHQTNFRPVTTNKNFIRKLFYKNKIKVKSIHKSKPVEERTKSIQREITLADEPVKTKQVVTLDNVEPLFLPRETRQITSILPRETRTIEQPKPKNRRSWYAYISSDEYVRPVEVKNEPQPADDSDIEEIPLNDTPPPETKPVRSVKCFGFC
jgi:hypothetical protein